MQVKEAILPKKKKGKNDGANCRKIEKIVDNNE